MNRELASQELMKDSLRQQQPTLQYWQYKRSNDSFCSDVFYTEIGTLLL